MIYKDNPYLARSKGDNPYIKKETEFLEPVYTESLEPAYTGIATPAPKSLTSHSYYGCVSGEFTGDIALSGTFVTGGFDWLT